MFYLAIIALAFGWLLWETDFLRVRLPYGATSKNLWEKYFGRLYPDLANLPIRERQKPTGYQIVNTLSNKKPAQNGSYIITLDPGIDNVLCGKDWLQAHWADLIDYEPSFELDLGSYRQRCTFRDENAISAVMKVNISRAELKRANPDLTWTRKARKGEFGI